MMELDPKSGLFIGARQYTITVRKDKAGNPFRPVSSENLHPTIQAKYGTVRAATVHCTDILCDAGRLARLTATSSPRRSGYHLLIGLDGDLHQLAPIHWIVWHAGRNLEGYLKVVTSASIAVVDHNKGSWKSPVVDGVTVGNPNNWGPGIEIMGKPGRPTTAQLVTLANVLRELYAKTTVTPDTVWAHGDLDPLHRHDPGFDVSGFAHAVADGAIDARELDGWDAEG